MSVTDTNSYRLLPPNGGFTSLCSLHLHIMYTLIAIDYDPDVWTDDDYNLAFCGIRYNIIGLDTARTIARSWMRDLPATACVEIRDDDDNTVECIPT